MPKSRPAPGCQAEPTTPRDIKVSPRLDNRAAGLLAVPPAGPRIVFGQKVQSGAAGLPEATRPRHGSADRDLRLRGAPRGVRLGLRRLRRADRRPGRQVAPARSCLWAALRDLTAG